MAFLNLGQREVNVVSTIQLLIQIIAAIPVIDKWMTAFAKEYNEYKVSLAEAKARETGNVEDLQKEAGKDT